jgi:hypothetical protein
MFMAVFTCTPDVYVADYQQSIGEDGAQRSGELDSSGIKDHQNDRKWQKYKQNSAVKEEKKMGMFSYFIQKKG